jgi:hypothetical protein
MAVSLPLLWKPDSKSPLRFGVDVSRHQGRIDWMRVLAVQNPIVQFFAIRGPLGGDGVDSQVIANWRMTQGFPVKRMLYHLRIPSVSWDDHVENLLTVYDMLLRFGPADGIIFDDELAGTETNLKHSTRTEHYCETIEERLGLRVIIYSRVEFMLRTMAPGEWMKRFLWHFAQYTFSGREHLGPWRMHPNVPRENVVMIQTTQRLDGRAMGTESRQLDGDRWVGTDAQWNALRAAA